MAARVTSSEVDMIGIRGRNQTDNSAALPEKALGSLANRELWFFFF